MKRLRIFGGPNGSGKTTSINRIKERIGQDLPIDFFGVYINADDIEAELSKSRKLKLDTYRLNISTDHLRNFFRDSKFSPVKLDIPDLWKYFSITEKQLEVDRSVSINSYIAADIAEFMRNELLETGESFSFETVMSDRSKLSLIKKAKELGYRIYLYYVATEDPEINISRVNVRVSEKGHNVNPELIKKRYYKSLENLREAVHLTNRAYLFDNSGSISIPFAEITEGFDVTILEPDHIPRWFIKCLVD